MIYLGRTLRSTLPKEMRQGRSGHFEKPFELDGRTYYISAIMREDGLLEPPIFVLGAARHIVHRYDTPLYPNDVIGRFSALREAAKDDVEVEVEHNLPKPALVKSLRALAEQEGILHELETEIRKSLADHEEEKVPERWMRQLNDEMERRHEELLGILADNLERWINAQFPEPKRKSRSIFKATRKQREFEHILTPEQIRQLIEIIRDHYAIFIADPSRKDQAQVAFQSMNLVVPDVEVRSLLRDAFLAGRFYDLLRDDMTLQRARQILGRQPLSREMVLAMQMAEEMGGQYIQPLVARVAEDVTAVISQQNYRLVGELVRDYIAGTLKVTERNVTGLTPEEAERLATDKTVQGWRRLTSELRNRFRTDELKRDWHRVAITETRWAANAGRLWGLQEDGIEEMYWLVQPTACDGCKTLYLNPDGTPKVFKVSEVIDNFLETGGMNFRRKKSLIGKPGGWIVTGGVLHPNDQCRPMAKIPGVEPVRLTR